jgi:hypothetical protein
MVRLTRWRREASQASTQEIASAFRVSGGPWASNSETNWSERIPSASARWRFKAIKRAAFQILLAKAR